MKYTDKIYGEFEITGIIEKLIKTKVFQRLKKVHQGGAVFLTNPTINQTRFEHSIGVMLLIKKLGGNIESQIAGLIHDISHTAFSHLVDYVFENEEEDYHEKRFEEVLSSPELVNLFNNFGFDWRNFLELEQFPILEYPLPSLSADRIDYTLRDLYQLGKLPIEEIDWFLEGLQVFENRIVVNSKEHGIWFLEKYKSLIFDYFEKRENKEINFIMTKIIKECLTDGTIEEEDFYHDDFYLISKIEKKVNLLKKINNLKQSGVDLKAIKTKKRMVNPEILLNNQIVKLSELD